MSWERAAMMRALTLGCVLFLGATTNASACLSSYYFEGIAFFDTPPPVETADTLVLDVIFDEDQIETLNGVVTARVRRVLHGDYTGESIRVGLGSSSCTSSFEFGREGIIAGHLVTPAEGQERVARRHRVGEFYLSWPFSETVLVPIEETRADRELRIAGLTRVSDSPTAIGDYDGDERTDVARFFENGDGQLVIGVRFASQGPHVIIWRGHLSSRPYFTFRTAPAGTYRTMRHLYGEESGVPREVALTHEAIIVTALEGPAEFLYYWHDGSFQNVVISE